MIFNSISCCFKEIGTPAKISSGGVKHILDKVGLKSLCWSYPYHPRISQEEKETIKRSEEIPMSDRDISYFLKTTTNRIKNHRMNTSGKVIKIPYRIASQIYEAQDLKFTNEETQQLLNVSRDAVNYALEQRLTFEPRIVQALQILYPKQKITTPYLPLRE